MNRKAFSWAAVAVTIAVVAVAALKASSDPLPTAMTDSEARLSKPVAAGASSAASTNCGDVNASGTITSSDVIGLVNYVFKGGAAPSCPDCNLAWGTVLANSITANPGSGNWTCVWNATYSYYEITITGEVYFYTSYHTSITPLTGSARVVTTNSISGKLVVYMYTLAGTQVQSAFSFSVIRM
jgi:hypothetical protein